ncbi:S8 family serine peptidase [Shewanella sedimentimangrovi]|uniref:S8 family serine peptidase n=1 Tax=Shewanella sedimentimangrovi TaxID=2814293 RepID=A0ABX7QY31_9GAMM|nr:S8 family serine peptidase [Shewanella sedimentimangrovi]QSX36354.1 S8 family serine peptidase [Shewanella sedimentimangrovi]
MKLKKISMMTIAAMYAAGAGAGAVDNAAVALPQAMPDFIKEIKITPEMMEASKARSTRADRFHHGKTQAASPSQPNTHRAPVQKVDFVWENDVEGVHTYIIEFNDDAVATYNGNIRGLAATASRSLAKVPSSLATTSSYKIDAQSPEVKNYVNYLEQKQQLQLAKVAAIVGSDMQVKRSFKFALNGATVPMTQEQAAKVSRLPGVRNVQRSVNYSLNTDVGPTHIRANEIWIPGTLGLANKGEGVVVGILDTGINSDHPSFAATAGDGYVHSNPRGRFYGDCEKPEFADMCNDKLIGVRSYPIITDTYSLPVFQDRWFYEQVDPKRPENGEDYQGHGSHTASTVAGNDQYDVPYQISEFAERSDGIDTDLKFPHISGVAPRANIIAYQVCYAGDGSYSHSDGSTTDQYQGCPSEALLAAFEDAILDKVDVINFSIGGGERSPWESSLEMAFLAAREAGIVVAASAGNSAWDNIDHVSPWVTSVAATTHGRSIEFSEKRLEAMSGGDTTPPSDLVGGGYTAEGFTGNFVLAANFGDALCNTPFPADTFTANQIVVCKRGDIPRLEKAVNVQAGGAGAMVLYNADYTQDAPWGYKEPNDPYVIPGILLPSWPGQQLVSWLSSGTGHMGTINASTISTKMGEADYVAPFSSRGPSRTTPDSMAPNVGAPGVDVFAAFADDHPFTRTPFSGDYTLMSGTSMAGPHVAGAMALLRQQYLDWTAAEIESALVSTARNSAKYLGYWGDTITAGLDDVGAGVIDVKAASMAGLIMDETADNYRAANPNNGGNLSSLNTPYLFATSCEMNCSFVRTFRATEDGSWKIDMAEHSEDGLPLLNLNAMPSNFTLKKGEVQTVVFTAAVNDISNIYGGIQDVQFEGHVTITPDDSNKAVQTLPMRVGFNNDGLPNDLSMDMPRTKSENLTPPLRTKEVASVKVNGLVKGEQQVHNLVPYSLGINTPEDIANDPGIAQINFTIPEGTKRFVFEVPRIDGYTIYHDTAIDVGYDANNDGQVQWHEEAICYSWSYDRDFCSVENPKPGNYWALVGNYTLFDPNYTRGLDQPLAITTSLAIIPEGANGSMDAAIVGEANGADAYRVNMSWDVPDAEQGDVYYAAVEFNGNDSQNGDVGMMGVRLESKPVDFILHASQDAAKIGDVIEFQMQADANMMERDRNFRLQTMLPEGLTLVKESVQVEGIYADMTSVEGNDLVIEGVQPTSAYTPRRYVWTTNETDPNCRQPYEDLDNQDNFIDLSHFMFPTGIEGNVWDSFYVDIWATGFEKINHYGQDRDGLMQINPAGFIAFDGMPYMNWWHMSMEGLAFPDTMVAPLWHHNGSIAPGVDWNTGLYTGLFFARSDKEIFFQWSDMQIKNWMGWSEGSYTFQTIYAVEPDFNEGKNEIIFAYKRLDPALKGQGSIGTRGYHGFRNPFGPNEGWLADTFAYDNVLSRVSEFSMVCGNYEGPEQSAVRVKFNAVVNNAAAGQDLQLKVSSDYDNASPATLSHSIKVNGNIKMGQFNAATIDENTSLKDLAVLFSSTTSSTKQISVSGEHITGTVHGHTPGSKVDITPDADWHGETLVTITVSDAANSSDTASASFMLTVLSDGIEKGCMDSNATNFDANANTDDGSCQYPAPPAAPVTPESSGGGSLGWLSLGLLSLLGLRRRQR